MTQQAPLPRRAWLELPGGKLHAFTGECRIGRVPDGNDLVLNEQPVSSRHLIITRHALEYTLTDQRSTNGTYVNGIPVQKPTRIKDGDTIRVAKAVLLRFRCARDEPPASPEELTRTTVVRQDFEERNCWLMLVDVVGFSELLARFGNEGAMERLQAWIADIRPMIEGNGGTINRYAGDAVFATWSSTLSEPQPVLAAAKAIENYRTLSSVEFRVVVHHGSTFFTRSEMGEEFVGPQVNFLFRSKKIARRFGCSFMLSQAAVLTLQLEGACDSIGSSAVDGIDGHFMFFRFPHDLGGGGTTPAFAKRVLLVEESSVMSDGFARLIDAERDIVVCDRAQHGASARLLHAKHKPDLVIIDLALRTGETISLIGDLMQTDPKTRVLVVTGLSDPGYIERALHAGALGYMLKSDPTAQVLEAIRAVSKGGRYLSRQIAGVALRKFGVENAGSTPRAGPSSLSDREFDVFRLIGLGQQNRDIAVALGISVKTVEAHREHIKLKLKLASAAELSASAKNWAESAGDRALG